MITALLRKDRRFLFVFAVLGMAAHGFALFTMRFEELWLYPDWGGVATAQMVALWLVAVPFGLYVGLRERLFRTEEYVRHRPITPAALFAARWLGACAVMAIWMVVPVLVAYAISSTRVDAVLMAPGMLISRLCAGAVAWPFFASAVLAATLSRKLSVAIVLGGPWPIFVAVVAGLSEDPGRWSNPQVAVALALGCALLAALLGLAAYQSVKHQHDADLPGRGRFVWPSRVVSVLGLVCVVFFFGSGIAKFLTVTEFPIVLSDDGRIGLAVFDGRNRRFAFVDQDLRPLRGPDGTTLFASERAVQLFAGRYLREFSPRLAWRRSFISRDWRRTTLFDHEHGRFEVVKVASSQDLSFYKRTIDKNGAPFSRATQIWPDSVSTVLYDPTDRSLWRFGQSDDFALQPISLPNGDQFVRRAFDVRTAGDLVRDIQGGDGRPLMVFVGEHGTYKWNAKSGGHFEPLSPDEQQIWETSDGHRAHTTGTLNNFDLTITDRSGAVVFTHLYRPTSFWNRTGVAAAAAVTVLVQPAAFVMDPERWPPAMRYCKWAVGLLLGAHAFVRLRRLGAGLSRRLLWSLSILCGGPVAYFAHRLWETNRAWRSLEALPTTAPVITERRRAPHEQVLLTG